MDTRTKILDIAMNLSRIGNWAADGYAARKGMIKKFLKSTASYIQALDSSKLPRSFAQTYSDFIKVYSSLEKEGIKGPKDTMAWAEKMMTWGNILTHRSKLI